MNTVIEKSFENAVRLLKLGEIAAIPTETVYGLAANALNSQAIAKIFAAKGRPLDNPLIIHVTDLETARRLGLDIPPLAVKLAERFWPGPLTMIFRKTDDTIPPEVSRGLNTVAVRAPAHSVTLEIIRQCGFPLAAPSANTSGSPSPTSAKHVFADLNGKIPLIVDGGGCEIGIESTVIAFEGGGIRLLRPGAVTPEDLREFAEIIIDEAVIERFKSGLPLSPGMAHKHYSPKAEVIAYKGGKPPFAKYAVDRPEASTLFAKLREFDEIGANRVYIRLPEPSGIGLALYNRIIRAADYKVINTSRIIGLTGMSGAGKSTVSKVFEKRGYFTVNMDVFANAVILNAECQAELRNLFPEMYDDNGVFDRKRAAAAVFSDKAKLKRYESVVFPHINRELLIKIEESGADKVLIDAPTLYQAGEDVFCEKVIAVVADRDICVSRIVRRDSISEKDAAKRLGSQFDADYFRKKADYIIENNGSAEESAERTNEVIDSIEEKSR